MAQTEKQLIDMLVKGGMDKKVAQEKVKAVIAKANEIMKGEDQESIDTVIMIKLKDMLKSASAEKYRGICVALDELRDSLGYQKYLALEAYKQDANRALADGMVKKEGDKLIPLDNRDFFDEAKTKPNKMKGKPLPVVMRREAYFVVDKKLVRAFGDFEAKVGGVYDIYGVMNDKGILNVGKTPEMRLVETLKDADLYKVVYDVAADSPMQTALSGIEEAAKGTTVITIGNIQHSQVTSNGGTMLVLADEEVTDGIVCFSATEAIGTVIQGLPKGAEAIVFGRVMKSGDRPKSLVVTGVAMNPGSASISKHLKSLDEYDF
jgi:hypothetical protein